MIRKRMYGNDLPFLAWCRAQEKGLPSVSVNCGVGINDVDCLIHRYITEVDGIGTREVQAIMQLEVKTRNGASDKSQHDTLWKVHNCIRDDYQKLGGNEVRHFGVSFLFLSHTTPEDSTVIQWGRFLDDTTKIVRHDITVHKLFKLLRFEAHPDTLCERWFRRHHKNREFWVVEKSPLGFEVERPLIIRS